MSLARNALRQRQTRDRQQAAHNSNRFIDDLLKGLGFQQCKRRRTDRGRQHHSDLYRRPSLCIPLKIAHNKIWQKATSHHVMTTEIPRNRHWMEQQHGLHSRSTSNKGAGTRLCYHQNSRYPVPKRGGRYHACRRQIIPSVNVGKTDFIHR